MRKPHRPLRHQEWGICVYCERPLVFVAQRGNTAGYWRHWPKHKP